MSKTSFEEFRDLVLADENLQKDLRRFSDRNGFIARVVEVALDHGFEFTASDIEEQMRIEQRSWTGSLI